MNRNHFFLIVYFTLYAFNNSVMFFVVFLCHLFTVQITSGKHVRVMYTIAPFPDLCLLVPLIPHFYIAKLRYGGLSIFLIFAPKHRLWVLVRTASTRRF